MGQIKDLMVQIQDMALNGYDADDIAMILEVPKSWVFEATGMVDDSEYDGQPDEAQEWHDFDPDC